MGDFNLNWLLPVSGGFKAFCDTYNLFQLVDKPTRPNSKFPEKFTLLDLVLTNAPHKYSLASVFENDIIDHCVVAVVRDIKMFKQKPRIITKRCMKHFNIQGFLFDRCTIWLGKNYINPRYWKWNYTWNYIYDNFILIINKHAPLKKIRVKCRDNPWFSTALSDLIRERDAAWAKARQTNLNPDWLYFKQLRNKCTVMIRKAKSEYFLDKTKKSANASKFWKNIKFLTGNRSVSALPNCITKDGIKIVDKLQMFNCFNSHFTESGSLFQTNNYTTVNSEFLNAERHLWTTEFIFNRITTSDVCSALQNLDVNKSSGPDLIEPLFLKLAANIISQPLSYLFKLSLTTKEIPQIWKSAFVVPLLKGGVPTLLDNYRPISKLCILSKLLESFISKQLTQQ